MRIPLAAMTRRARPNGRRKAITLQPITLPATRATNLYRAAYLPIIEIWTNALPALEAEYGRSLAEITTDSAATLEAEIERAANLAGAFVLGVRARVEGWARLAEAWHRMRWRRTVLSATTIDLATLIGPQDVREALETVIARNVALIRNVSDQTRQRIADSVFRGLQNRTPPRIVAREIADAVGMGRKRALVIAADQNVKLSSALNEERRRQAGIDSYIWRHSGKRHAREEHKVRDGQYYTENPERVGTEYQGKIVRREVDAGDRPGIPPYCGCTSQALLILE